MPSIEFDIGIAMGSEVDDKGHLSVQVDGYGEGQAGVAPYEVQAVGGILRRPLDPVVDGEGQPDPTKACPTMYGMEGGRGHAFPLLDPRTVAKMPVIQKGEALVPGDAGQFIKLHADGSITLWTTDKGGDPSGQRVSLKHGPDGLEYFAPWGRIKADQTGAHIETSSGAKLNLGAIGGMPPPLDALTSYCNVEAASVSIKAAIVALGPDATSGAVADSAVKATPLLAMLGQLVAALNAVQATIAGVAGAATFPLLPVSAAAIAAAQASLAALPQTMQSSVTVT